MLFVSGFVALQELLSVPILGQYSEEEIMDEIKTSHSNRGSYRFDSRVENGKVLVRATYGRKLEKASR